MAIAGAQEIRFLYLKMFSIKTYFYVMKTEENNFYPISNIRFLSII